MIITQGQNIYCKSCGANNMFVTDCDECTKKICIKCSTTITDTRHLMNNSKVLCPDCYIKADGGCTGDPC
jgi:DNA-directed RNA polymerase subunit RPC12/RpoP